jgi:hypothetical protein
MERDLLHGNSTFLKSYHSMGVGQGENGKERESLFAEIAEPAVVLDPVVTVVMRLLAPPAMTDDRIAQTEGTPADKLVRRC